MLMSTKPALVRLAACATLAGALLAPLPALADGTVQFLSGTISVQRADGSVRLLSEKSQIISGDTVTTERESYAQVRFTNGSAMTLRPNTQVRLDNYAYNEAAPQEDSFLMSLVKGGMRKVTGLIGKRSTQTAFQLKTATATIGIRGTDFNVIDVPPNAGAGSLPPGVYVTVNDGAVAMATGGGETLVGAGQTGFSSSVSAPPQIVPPPPNLPRVAPPNFTQPGRPIAPSGQLDCPT